MATVPLNSHEVILSQNRAGRAKHGKSRGICYSKPAAHTNSVRINQPLNSRHDASTANRFPLPCPSDPKGVLQCILASPMLQHGPLSRQPKRRTKTLPSGSMQSNWMSSSETTGQHEPTGLLSWPTQQFGPRSLTEQRNVEYWIRIAAPVHRI